MRKRIGTFCLLLGAACLLGAIGFVIYNRWEAKNAATHTQSLLEDVQFLIDERTQNTTGETEPEQNTSQDTPPEQTTIPTEPEPTLAEMATISVDGYDCIGILSIPVLELELPVLADWSYTKLKKAPCHYYGSYYEPDFVIAAHNYQSHFGRLSELLPEDLIVFTAVDGTAYHYQVVLLETLPEEATMEMITSGFALSLYTCTPGGGSRVTVRCKQAS